MGWIAKDLPTLIFTIVPGFITAWIYFGLTAHPKPSEFERVVQALIFTSFLRLLTSVVKILCLFAGTFRNLGIWNSDVELAWGIGLAVPLGLVLAWLVNNDKLHRLMRKCKLTVRTSYPSEWYSVFVTKKRWLILHLSGERRLFGWPEEWPEQPDRGHFVIDQPEWLLDNNERKPLIGIDRLLLPAVDVKMVEFLSMEPKNSESPSELSQVEQSTIRSQNEEQQDGSESTTTGTEPSADSD